MIAYASFNPTSSRPDTTNVVDTPGSGQTLTLGPKNASLVRIVPDVTFQSSSTSKRQKISSTSTAVASGTSIWPNAAGGTFTGGTSFLFSASGTNLHGSVASFVSAMNPGMMMWADGTTSMIVAFVDTSNLTLAVATTKAAQAGTLYYNAAFVSADAGAGISVMSAQEGVFGEVIIDGVPVPPPVTASWVDCGNAGTSIAAANTPTPIDWTVLASAGSSIFQNSVGGSTFQNVSSSSARWKVSYSVTSNGQGTGVWVQIVGDTAQYAASQATVPPPAGTTNTVVLTGSATVEVPSFGTISINAATSNGHGIGIFPVTLNGASAFNSSTYPGRLNIEELVGSGGVSPIPNALHVNSVDGIGGGALSLGAASSSVNVGSLLETKTVSNGAGTAFSLPTDDTSAGDYTPLSSFGTGALSFSTFLPMFRRVAITTATGTGSLADAFTDAIPILPAPGASSYIRIHSADINWYNGTVAPTGGQNFWLIYGNTANDEVNTATTTFGNHGNPVSTNSDYLTSATCCVSGGAFGAGPADYLASANVINQPISLTSTGLIGGNATAAINLWYSIVPAV